MFLKTLILKNFKSFRNTTIHFDKGFSVVVGPNGSGKSNLIDAVQFVFGESRFRALRAKKARDLIYKSAKVGEVSLEFADADGKVVHTINRAVRNDGKIRYKLDGKVSKRYVIEELLAHNSLSSHNIIQQGQVQRIVEMNSKERRLLIDNIANVSEYEDKKKESLGELSRVQEKLKEASAILAEREGYLQQLKQDKEDAEKFVSLKGELDSLKATILSVDAKQMEGEFESLVSLMLDSKNKVSAIHAEVAKAGRDIQRKQEEKTAVDNEILKRSQGRQVHLQQEIDELNNSIKVAKAVIEDKKAILSKTTVRNRELSLERQRAFDELRGLGKVVEEDSREVDSLKGILSEKKTAYELILKDSDKFSSEFYDARKVIEDTNAEMMQCKESLNAIQTDVSALREKQRLKQSELERLKAGLFDDFSKQIAGLEKELKALSKNLAACEDGVSSFFERERELNACLPKIDAALLEARDKVVELQSRLKHTARSSDSAALRAVLDLSGKLKGVYGTVEQLCQYESKYTVPVQVALGSRLNYVVVDSSNTAARAIDYLKKNKLGRVSFIPLDKIRAGRTSETDYSSHASSLGFLVDFLKFESQFAKAFKYAISDTLLVSSLKSAQGLVGKTRFVSMDGELAEVSGLLTGGSLSPKVNALKDQRELQKQAQALDEAKAEKEDVLAQLKSLSEQARGVRKARVEAELKEKTCRLELENFVRQQENAEKQQKDVRAAVKELEGQVKLIDGQCDGKDEERAELIRRLSDLNMRLLDSKQKVDVEKEQNFGIKLKETERELSDLRVSVSEYENKVAANKSKMGVYQKRVDEYDKYLSSIESDVKAAEKAVSDSDELIKKSRTTLKEKVAEQKNIAGALKEFIDLREKLEKDIQRLGNQKGKLEFDSEKISVKSQDLQVKKAVLETNLANLKAEMQEFKDAEVLGGKTLQDKPKLLQRKSELEPQVSTLSQSVNLKSLEVYQERLNDFEDQKQKVGKLGEERQAVLDMIEEVEGKKIAAFMKSFDFISESFQKLFSQIFKGGGSLVLENPENPFEGGLTMQVKLENKEVKYLELMSGGEKSLLALIFIFALQSYRPSSVYILDEADAALDQDNSLKLVQLLTELSKTTQFLVISHNSTVYKDASCLIGVAMTSDGSKLVEVKLNK